MRSWSFHRADSPFGRLDARMKLALGFFVSVQVVLADNPVLQAALACLGLCVFLTARPTAFQAKLTVLSIVLLVWGLMLSQGFFYNAYPRTVLVRLLAPNPILREGLNIYREGVRYGMIQALRLMALLLTGYAICFSTEPDQFLRGLVALRAPFSLSFMAVTAIRFVPIVAGEFATVRAAMRMKGYRPFRRGLADTLRTEVSSLRPVLAGAVRRSEQVALAIVTRGFSFEGARTSLHEQHLRPWHWAALALMFVLTAAIGACKVLFWLYQSEVYYTSSLRALYQFTRDWL